MSTPEVSLWPQIGSSHFVSAFCQLCHTLGFVHGKTDSSLFILKQGNDTTYLLLMSKTSF